MEKLAEKAMSSGIVDKIASSSLAEKVVSSDLGQKIISSVAPTVPDKFEVETNALGTPIVPGMPVDPLQEKLGNVITKASEIKEKVDDKINSYYWTLRIILVLVVVTIISIIIYKYKLPLICYGCETPEGFSKYIFSGMIIFMLDIC